MNRRAFFTSLVGALCAASIELTGIQPELPDIKKFRQSFVQYIVDIWEEKTFAAYFNKPVA